MLEQLSTKASKGIGMLSLKKSPLKQILSPITVQTPTLRAISLLNQLLTRESHADIFNDNCTKFFKNAVLFLNYYYSKSKAVFVLIIHFD